MELSTKGTTNHTYVIRKCFESKPKIVVLACTQNTKDYYLNSTRYKSCIVYVENLLLAIYFSHQLCLKKKYRYRSQNSIYGWCLFFYIFYTNDFFCTLILSRNMARKKIVGTICGNGGNMFFVLLFYSQPFTVYKSQMAKSNCI